MAGEQVNNAKSLKQLLADQNRLLTEQTRILKEQAGGTSELLSDQQDISNVIKDQIKSLKFQRTEKTLLRQATNDINKISQETFSIGKNQLGIDKQSATFSKQKVSLEKKIRILKQQQGKFSKSQSVLDQDIAVSIGMQVDEATKLKLQLDGIAESSQRIKDNFGVKTFGNLANAVKSVPGISAFSAPFEAASEAALQTSQDIEHSLKTGEGLTKDMVKKLGLADKLKSKSGNTLSGTAGAKKFDKLGSPDGKKMLGVIDRKGFMSALSGIKSLGKSLTTALAPAVMLAELLKALIASDAAAGDMAKSMNMSYDSALATRMELKKSADSSFNNFVNTKGMQDSLVAMNKSLGTGGMLSKDMLVQMTEMREMAGFTNKEVAAIGAISLTTGKSMNDITGEFMAQAQISSTALGVKLNEKDLLKDIGNISAATTLSLGKNPALIAEAAATAKALGMELSKVDSIAGSLLDFESSIENELQAELLLGKDINLEKARQAALNNDLATVAKEISEQAGSSAEFAEMNRIQQEALAKSIGMSREDLAQTLFVQEQLAGATGDQAAEQEALLNNRIAEVGLQQAQKELADGGVEGLRNQNSQAERLGATLGKIKELFVSIAEPILMLTDMLMPVVEFVGMIVSGFMMVSTAIGDAIGYVGNLADSLGPIKYILKGVAGVAIILASMLAFGALAGIPVVGPVLGAAAAAGIVTAGFTKLAGADKVGDMNSPAFGKTQVSTKEGGLFELSKNDDFVAFPGASQMANQGQSQTVVNSKTDMNATNALLSQLIKKTPDMAPLGLYEVQ